MDFTGTTIVGVVGFIVYSVLVYALATYVGPIASLSLIAATILASEYYRKSSRRTNGQHGVDTTAPSRTEKDGKTDTPMRVLAEARRASASATTTTAPREQGVENSGSGVMDVVVTEDVPLWENDAWPDVSFVGADLHSSFDNSDAAHTATTDGVAGRQRKNTIPMDGNYAEFLEDMRDQPRSVGLRRGNDVLVAGNDAARRARMRDIIERKAGYNCPNERMAKFNQRQLDMRIAIRNNTRKA